MDKAFLEKCLGAGMSTRDIEKVCGLKKSTIGYWINKYGLNEQNRFKKLDKYVFEKVDTKEKAYVLGFLLADSAINQKKMVEISVALSDKEVVEFISGVISSNVTYDHAIDKKAHRFPRARTSMRISDITKFTGGEKKEDRHYPIVRDDLERYLIQGFFDADGCITYGRRKDKNRIWQKVCFNSQLGILEGVQKYLIKQFGISTVIHPKSGNEKCYIMEFSNRDDVMKFCQHIYPDDSFIILHRKYSKYSALRLELEENGEGKQTA